MVNYFIEAIMVGIMTLVLGTIISVLFMYTSKDFSIKKIDFWPSLLASNFMLGFLLHIICEWTGINKWYCKNGSACK